MSNFFKSYYEEVYKPNIKWTKTHWKGLIVTYCVAGAIEMGWIFRDQIKEKVSEKIEERKMKKELQED